MQQTDSSSPISLTGLISRFRGRISLTMFFVLAESVLNLLFPLFIGNAINGLLVERYTELIALGLLGLITLFIGSMRRFYDTRAYAGIYMAISTEMVAREQQKQKPLSAIAARTTLLTEFVEFLENSMPEIVTQLIGVVGVLIIILTLNHGVFIACLLLLCLMVLIYMLTGNWNFRLNRHYNDTLEQQVDALATQNTETIRQHFKTVMKWNIRLSDLETMNYALIWTGIIALLVYAPVAVIGDGAINYGLIFSALMYVFQYIEGLVILPLYIQQLIRLQEITVRLRT